MTKVNSERIQKFLKKCDKGLVTRSTLYITLLAALAASPKEAKSAVKDGNFANTEQFFDRNDRIERIKRSVVFNADPLVNLNKEEYTSFIIFKNLRHMGITMGRHNNRNMYLIDKEALQQNSLNLDKTGLAFLREIDPAAYQKLTNSDKMLEAYSNGDLLLDGPTQVGVTASFDRPGYTRERANYMFARRIINCVVSHDNFIDYDKKGNMYFSEDKYNAFSAPYRGNRAFYNICKTFESKSYKQLKFKSENKFVGTINETNRGIKKFQKGVDDVTNTTRQASNAIKDVSEAFRILTGKKR